MRAGSGCLRHGTPVSRAPPFSFAGVLAWAALGGLATALALAFVFPFAGMFTLLRVVQCLSGDSRLSLSAGRIGAYGERAGHEAGDRCPRDHCFGWFYHRCLSHFELSRRVWYNCAAALSERTSDYLTSQGSVPTSTAYQLDPVKVISIPRKHSSRDCEHPGSNKFSPYEIHVYSFPQ
jgi:hypothetical protein